MLEVMIVVAILATLASIGVPQYLSALQTARVGKAKHELRTISNAVDAFTANNHGVLPLTLYQVGFGGKRDPWGMPYCYLNYADGSGDGLDWAIAAGLVDPSAFAPVTGGAGGGDGGSGWDGLAAPQGFGQTIGQRPVRIRIRFDEIGERIGRNLNMNERGSLAGAAQQSGSFSIFTGVSADMTRRRDRYMFPLNTDYDLFSLGPDHSTACSLGESVGMDDVIRANNGGFFGRASDY